MDIPKFFKGETLSAEKLNALSNVVRELSEECQSAKITSVQGGTFTRGRFGTALSVQGGGRRKSDGDGNSYIHPFKVTANYADGKVSIRMKGGRWHGNGAGNYLGISYLDTSADDLAERPESVGTGEDLFFIPDLQTTQQIAEGETFAICLYSPDAVCGKVKTYPWAYYKKIENAKSFREELVKYAYSTVAIVGIWKLAAPESEGSDGSQLELQPVPGQMLFGDFFYKNNQIFSAGNFGWSRIEGVEYAFRVSPGLVYVRPNVYAWKAVSGDLAKLSAAAAEYDKSNETLEDGRKKTNLIAKGSITTVALSTEFTDESITVLTKAEMSETGESEIRQFAATADVPYYSVSSSSTSKTVVTDITNNNTTISAKVSSSDYSLTLSRDDISANPTQSELITKTFLTNAVLNKTENGSETISVAVPKASATYEKLSYVTNVSATKAGTTTVDVPITLDIEKSELTTETSELGKLLTRAEIQYTDTEFRMDIYGELPGGDVDVEKVTDEKTAKSLLGIPVGDLAEGSDLNPFFQSVPTQEFSFTKDEIANGILVALHCSVANGQCDCEYKIISREDLTASVKHPTPVYTSQRFDVGLAETPQTISIEIEQRVSVAEKSESTETASEETTTASDESESEEKKALWGIRAALNAAGAGTFSATFPVALVFLDKETGIPTAQPLVSGVIEYRPTLNIALNTTNTPQSSGCEFSAVASPGAAKTFAEKKLLHANSTETESENADAQAAFTASAYGLETADLNDVWNTFH